LPLCRLASGVGMRFDFLVVAIKRRLQHRNRRQPAGHAGYFVGLIGGQGPAPKIMFAIAQRPYTPRTGYPQHRRTRCLPLTRIPDTAEKIAFPRWAGD
jgi:hypothetical protein